MIPQSILQQIIPRPFAYGSYDHVRAGWIFPDRSVVPCKVMQHLSVLPGEFRERYDQLITLYDAEWDSCHSSEDHVPWHLYDPKGSANHDLMRDLAYLGYMRFGTFRDHRGNSAVEFGGSKQHLREYHDLLRFIVAAVGARDVFFTDHETYTQVRKRQRHLI